MVIDDNVMAPLSAPNFYFISVSISRTIVLSKKKKKKKAKLLKPFCKTDLSEKKKLRGKLSENISKVCIQNC